MSKSIERIVLALFLVLLIAAAGGLAFIFPKLSDLVGFTDTPKGGPASKVNEEKLTSSLNPLKSPAVWKDNEHRLFNSVDVLFFPSQYPDPKSVKVVDPETASSVKTLHGVPFSWYMKYHINYVDPNVDYEDPDKDGFSNIVEFKNEQVGQRLNAEDLDGSNSTDPNDPNSHPPYLARLRLKQYESRPFKLTFNSYTDLGGKTEVQIHIDGIPSEEQPGLLKTGDSLSFEGQNYIVGEVKIDVENKMDPAIHEMVQEDDSTVDLIEPDLKEHITLPLHKQIDAPESTADFIMLMPNELDKVLKVRKGKILTLTELPDQKFQVVTVDDNGATIRDTKTGKDYPVLKLEPSDLDEVPSP